MSPFLLFCLNGLGAFARGALNGAKDSITTPSHSQSWILDAEGNFAGVTADGTTQTRTHNQQNEITGVSGAGNPEYDVNGNLTKDQPGQQYVYDAWNRLVKIKNSGGTVIQTYAYDALNRRATENSGPLRDLYYNDRWQVVQEQEGAVIKAQPRETKGAS